MATKIVYHARSKFVDCADGITSAWVARKVFPDGWLVPCWYLDEESAKDIENYPQFESGDYVVVVDFSFPAWVVKHFESLGVTFLIIDHHVGVLKDYLDYFKGDVNKKILKSEQSKFVYDIDESGATLTWKYFFGATSMPIFLEYTRDRDIWTKILPYTEEVYAGVTRLRSKKSWNEIFEVFDSLEKMSWTDLVDYLEPIGTPIVVEKRKKIDRAIKKCGIKPITLAGLEGGLVTLRPTDASLYSDIAEAAYMAHPEYAYILIQMPREKDSDQIKYSLRSDQNNPIAVDCDALAKLFGGKGHKHAAGFYSAEIPYQLLELAEGV